MSKEKHILIDDKFIESEKIAMDIMDIIEPVWYSVDCDSEEKYYNDLKHYSKEQSYVFALLWYYSEVCNGGHAQFYSNPTGIVWEEALKGAKEIGLDEVYNIIKKSVEIMGGSPSKDRDERENELDNINVIDDDPFKDLDIALGAIDYNFIDGKYIEYVKSHKEKFYFNGTIII